MDIYIKPDKKESTVLKLTVRDTLSLQELSKYFIMFGSIFKDIFYIHPIKKQSKHFFAFCKREIDPTQLRTSSLLNKNTYNEVKFFWRFNLQIA